MAATGPSGEQQAFGQATGTTIDLEDRMAGVLLGTAVGDALGLPREGLSRQRAERLFGRGSVRHAFIRGQGMVSDDTELTCLTAQALLAAPDDPRRFVQRLAWHLRWWLLRLPAGVGWATLRATIKLLVGISPDNSGVGSDGNGPAMRAAVIGACLRDNRKRLIAMCEGSSLLTHQSNQAVEGAIAVALAAAHAVATAPGALRPAAALETLRAHIRGHELLGYLKLIEALLQQGAEPIEMCTRMGLSSGVTGYTLHTVPVALYCWLRSPEDFTQAVESVIKLGGDTDTTGAIVGALVGATAGAARIPQPWLSGLADRPVTVAWMRELARELARTFAGGGAGPQPKGQPLPLAWPKLLVRNLVFLGLVLGHGVRRALPPY
jgi:ADP-ribosylglycohydrolase